MKSWGDFFRRRTPRTASSIPWFTRYSASYKCAFSMTERPFSGEVAASSEVDWSAETHVLDAAASRRVRTNEFRWTELRVGDARHAEVQIVGWKRSGDGWVAPVRGTHYLL